MGKDMMGRIHVPASPGSNTEPYLKQIESQHRERPVIGCCSQLKDVEAEACACILQPLTGLTFSLEVAAREQQPERMQS